jgi:hypothetical protein
VPIQKRLFFDGRDQLSAVSHQPNLVKTSGWLSAESSIQKSLISGWLNRHKLSDIRRVQSNEWFVSRQANLSGLAH